MAKGYSWGQDPYRDLERLIPAKVSSKDSLKNILSGLGGVQTGRIALAALGEEEPAPKTKRGFVSTILDPEKGLLFAPARFVSAGVADVLGLAKDEVPELEDYNPLESAIRSAKGEFAVTGGDVFKVEDDESILGRVAKLAGAFGYDVLTDPLNYFGGTGVFSRKGVLKLVADPEISARLISNIETGALARNLNPTELVTNLARKSRRVALGDLRYDAARKVIVNAADEVVPDTLVRQLAGDGLVNTIADSFTVKGRGGIIASLTTELGDQSLAKEVFERLPQELVGGVFLKNPVTGKPIRRVAGGKGTTNPFIEQANKARFRLSSASVGRTGSRNFSGKMGTTWAAYKHGLFSENAERLGQARTMFTDYVGYERALKQSGAEARRLSNKAHAVMSNFIQASKKNMTPEQEKEFKNGVAYFLSNKDAVVGEANPVVAAAYDAAQELRTAYNELHQELRAAGVPVGELDDFIPLLYSDEYVDFLSKIDPKQGPETRGLYRVTSERVAYGSHTPSEDELNALNVKRKFAPPQEANRVANKPSGFQGKIFEEDPIKQFQRYAEESVRTIAGYRLVQILSQSGTLMRLPSETLRTVNIHNAAAMISAIKELTPGAAEAAKRNLETVRRQLEELVSEETIIKRQKERASALGVATKAYNAAKRKEAKLRTQLRAIDIAITKTAPSLERLVKLAKDRGVGRTRVLEDRAVSIQRRHAARLRRLERQGVRLTEDLQETERILELTLEQGGEVDVFNPVTKQLETVTIEPAPRSEIAAARREAKEAAKEVKENSAEIVWETQYLRDIEEEIVDTRQMMDDWAEIGATKELDTLNLHLQSLEEKRVLTTQYLDAQNKRRAAKSNLDTLRKDVGLPRGQGVKIAVDAFVEARRKFLAFRASIGNVAIKNLPDDVRQQYELLKAASDEATKTLYRTVGYVRSRTGTNTAARQYAKTVVDLANNLNANEIAVAGIIANGDKMDEFMDLVLSQTSSHQVRMQALGDLMTAYRSIRKFVSEEQLDNLGKLEREVYTGFYEGAVPLKEVKKGRATRRLELLEDDLVAAKLRRAPDDEIAAIEDRINRLRKFVDEEGMRLLGAGKQRMPMHLQDVYGPQGVRDAMERLLRIENNPTEWEKFVSGILDPLALVWRTSATVGRGPGYLINNLVGGLLNNWLGGVSLKSHAKSGKILKAFYDGTKRAIEENPGVPRSALTDKALGYVRNELSGLTIGERDAVDVFSEFLDGGTWFTTDMVVLQDELRRAGMLADTDILASRPGVNYKWENEPSGVVEERFRRTIKFMLLNPMQSRLNDASQGSEMFLRFAAFIEGYERYGSRWAGEDLATMLHFDYQDLTDAERSIKRLMPFYTWTRNNVPLQLRALVTQQDKLRKIIIANENIKDAFGVNEDQSWLDQVLPDYIDINGGFATAFTFGGNHLALSPKTPLQDLDQFLQTNYIFGIPVPMPRASTIAGAFGPAVAPLEFIAGRSFDTGQTFDTAEEKLNWGLRTLVPYYGTAQRIAEAATVPLTLAGVDLSGVPIIDQQKGMASLFNFLAGSPYGVRTLTERDIAYGLRAQSENLNAQLAQLAAEANVDLDWLRKEIRKGTSLASLRIKIAMGEGNATMRALEKQYETVKPPSRDYNALLQSLSRGGYQSGY